MLSKFYPGECAESIFNVPYKSLMKKKITGLIFDVDNTLVQYDAAYPNTEVIALFDKLRSMGFIISLLSNNNRERLAIFNEKLNVIAVAKAGKPGAKGIKKAVAAMGKNKRNTALIGDQIFTDIWCANRFGIYSVLVKPISKREEFFIKPKRLLEQIILNNYYHNLAIIKHRKKGV